MRGKISLLFYDIKGMGISRYLPLVLMLFWLFYCQAFKSEPNGILQMLELFLPPISAWWIIYLFHDYVDDDGAEVFFSFSASRFFLGIIRVMIFYVLYMIFLFIFLVLMSKVGCISQQILGLYFIQLSVQSLFYGSCGFVFILRLKSSLWCIAVILSIAALTIWGNIPFINSVLTLRFYSNENMRFESMWVKMLILLCISVMLLYMGQRRFARYEHYQYDVSSKYW